MGNGIFWMLHIAACLFGFIGLFITIPLHLIYLNTQKKEPKKSRKPPWFEEWFF